MTSCCWKVRIIEFTYLLSRFTWFIVLKNHLFLRIIMESIDATSIVKNLAASVKIVLRLLCMDILMIGLNVFFDSFAHVVVSRLTLHPHVSCNRKYFLSNMFSVRQFFRKRLSVSFHDTTARTISFDVSENEHSFLWWYVILRDFLDLPLQYLIHSVARKCLILQCLHECWISSVSLSLLSYLFWEGLRLFLSDLVLYLRYGVDY